MDIRSRIIAVADRCVLCGMCLPHCPTYQLAQEEAESPRGRIVLAQALASGRLQISEQLVRHLDHCLACRACETVCPSRVEYGMLVQDTRALLANRRRVPFVQRAAVTLLTRRSGRVMLDLAARAQREFGLFRPAATGLPGRAAARLPAPSHLLRPPAFVPATGRRQGAVALFLGCTGELFDADALAAGIRLLGAAGFDIHIPPAQECCGALHTHAGDTGRAERLARRNIAAFSAPVDAVVAIASGCAATLAEYPRRFGEGFAGPVNEITAFLASHLPEDVRFFRLEKRVAIHEPCTQRRVLKAPGATRGLLARIPGIELFDLPDNERCCGAAGAHMLLEPDIADTLGEPKAAAARARGAEVLATTNIGCALHLRALLPADPPLAVEHPVVIAARQLIAASP